MDPSSFYFVTPPSQHMASMISKKGKEREHKKFPTDHEYHSLEVTQVMSIQESSTGTHHITSLQGKL